MSRSKIIFDTDPGVDDAMALLFALGSPEVEVIGITTVFGNGTIEATTRNALYLKGRFGIAAPVARGAGRPLGGGDPGEPPAFIHGENALGDIALPEKLAHAPHEAPAHRFIVDMVRAHPNEISLVAVGRVTNLALALREDPEIAGLVRQVVIMGGAFGINGHGGNITPAAEANIWGDPLAADEVFGAKWPIVVVGLDVTQETRMTTAFLRALGEEGGETGRFIWETTRIYERFHHAGGVDGIFVHDPSAIAYLVEPSLFTVRSGAIRVVTEGIAVGQTIQKPDARQFPPGPWDGRPSHAVCTSVDSDGLRALFFRAITRVPE